VYCCPSIFSLTSSPPSQTKCTVYTESLFRGGGGGEWCCVANILQEFYTVSDQVQTLPNYFTTPNKMTSENDIKELVFLKFLRPCMYHKVSKEIDPKMFQLRPWLISFLEQDPIEFYSKILRKKFYFTKFYNCKIRIRPDT